VNIIIHKRLSKMLIAIFKPFFAAQTPEQVKELLKEEGKIPTNVYRALFRKGIVNNLPKGAKALMYPAKPSENGLKRLSTCGDIDLDPVEEELPRVVELPAKSETDGPV
jgi:hypothetical protein